MHGACLVMTKIRIFLQRTLHTTGSNPKMKIST
jgi:hypothetical protein